MTFQLIALSCHGPLWIGKRDLVPSPKGESRLLLGLRSPPPNSTAGKEVLPVARAEFFGPSPYSGVSEVNQHSSSSSVVLCEEVG